MMENRERKLRGGGGSSFGINIFMAEEGEGKVIDYVFFFVG